METLTKNPPPPKKKVSATREEQIITFRVQQVGDIDSDIDALHGKFDNLGTSQEKCVLDIKNNYFETIDTLKRECECDRSCVLVLLFMFVSNSAI